MECDYVDIDKLKVYKGLQILQLNVRSLFHKIGALKNDLFFKNVGVFGLTEMWLNEHTASSLVNVQNFCLIRNDRGRGRGGGTCLYINEALEFEIPNDVISNKNIEIQSVTLLGRKNDQEHRPIVIILAYRPPNGNDTIACNTIKDYIKGISEYEKKEIVIMGDLNWDVYHDKSTGVKYVSKIADEFNLNQEITEPTRVTDTCSSVIDVVLTNVKNIAFSGCINYQVSDHYPVFIVKKRIAPETDFQYVYKRSFRDYDADEFRCRLAALDWSILDLLEVDCMWQMTVQALTYEADILCPYKWIRVNVNKPPWFTSEMSEIARDRDILFRNYRRGKKTNNLLHQKAVEKRRKFNKLIKESRDSYYNEQLTLHKNDKSSW